MMSSREELTAYGYLRSMLNDEQDYTLMITVIIEYMKQGSARYFDEKSNFDVKEM